MPSPRYQQIHHDPGPWLLPLGGCGQFGANFTLYGSQGTWIAIDCGIAMLAGEDGSTRTAVPSLAALERLDIQLSALIITHGHEDHIGAINTHWRQLACPIYATTHAERLIRSRLPRDENGPRLVVVPPLSALDIGPFRLEWIPVTHSIPESCGILIEVAGRRLYHTGDWKLDASPVVGRTTAVDRLQRLGQQGVDVVIGDSTNATVAGGSLSEHQVALALHRLLKPLTGRVVVSCFASNIARLASLRDIARRCGREASLLGPSLERHVTAARFGDYLAATPAFLSHWALGFLPRESQLWIATGSQGEPRSALARLAQQRHPALVLEAGDTVVFSSRVIPGNEAALESLQTQLRSQGVEIIDWQQAADIHASGHPPQDDLRQMYQWLKPRHLLPVHGEVRHQQAHAALAREMGITTLVPRNGDLICLQGTPAVRATTLSGLIDV